MRKYTIEEIRKIVESKDYKLVSGVYIDNKQKLTISDSDGYLYETRIANFKGGKMPKKFHQNNKYTLFNIKKWCIKNNKDFTIVSDEYVDIKKILLWKCTKDLCSEIFPSSFDAILFGGNGCSFCRGSKVGESNCLANKNPKLTLEWNNEKNKGLTPYEVTVSSNKKVWWKCLKCNHEWDTTIDHRSNGSGCPMCKESKLEKRILSFLDRNDIETISQYKFEDCKNIFQLPFDFYLPKYNKCIEADGTQHFKPVRFGGMSEEKANINFQKQQKRDGIKNDYCKNNNIELIRIPYWNFDNIEKILIKKLNL